MNGDVGNEQDALDKAEVEKDELTRIYNIFKEAHVYFRGIAKGITMDKLTVLSYIATALVLSAVYFISKPKLRGQYLIIAADITWLIYSLLSHQYALSLQSIVLLTIGISAVNNWKSKNIPF